MELDTIDELTTVNLENREHIYLSKYPFYTTTRGGIHFIGASPSHGKTQILLNLMFEIANMRTSEGIPAYNCLFVSLEMSKASIKERYIKLDPENWKKYMQEKTHNMNIIESNSMTVADLIKIVDNYESDLNHNSIDCVFIDYVQMFEANSAHDHEANSEALRIWAKESNRFVFLAAQMTTQFKFEHMQDASNYIGNTSKFGRDAVSIMTLFKKKDDEIWLSLGKNRNGQSLNEAVKYFLTKEGKIENPEYVKSKTSNLVYNKKDALIYNCAKAIFAANHDVDLNSYTTNEIDYLVIDPSLRTSLNQKLYTSLIGSLCLKKIAGSKCSVLYEKDLATIQEILDEAYELETGADLTCMTSAQETEYTKWSIKATTNARKTLTEGLHKIIPHIDRMVEAIGNLQHTLTDRDVIKREYMIMGGMND